MLIHIVSLSLKYYHAILKILRDREPDMKTCVEEAVIKLRWTVLLIMGMFASLGFLGLVFSFLLRISEKKEGLNIELPTGIAQT